MKTLKKKGAYGLARKSYKIVRIKGKFVSRCYGVTYLPFVIIMAEITKEDFCCEYFRGKRS